MEETAATPTSLIEVKVTVKLQTQLWKASGKINERSCKTPNRAAANTPFYSHENA
jgi:hypothetical protein